VTDAKEPVDRLWNYCNICAMTVCRTATTSSSSRTCSSSRWRTSRPSRRSNAPGCARGTGLGLATEARRRRPGGPVPPHPGAARAPRTDARDHLPKSQNPSRTQRSSASNRGSDRPRVLDDDGRRRQRGRLRGLLQKNSEDTKSGAVSTSPETADRAIVEVMRPTSGRPSATLHVAPAASSSPPMRT